MSYKEKIAPVNLNGGIEKKLKTLEDKIAKLKYENELLKEKEARLNLVINGTLDGIWDWADVSKEDEWWSPRFYELLGYKNKEIEASLSTFKKLLHPGDLEKTFDAINKCFNKSIPFDIEYRLKTKEEGHKWFRGKANVIRDSKGNVKRMAGAISDIHTKKIMEEELLDKERINNIILEGTMAGYWDWHITEEYEYMSPTFKKMFGFEDSEVPNHPSWWQNQIHPDDLPGVFEVFESHVKSKGQIPYDNIVRYYHKDGSIVWVYCRGKVIEWDERKNPIRMVGSHVDITSLKKIEEELKKANTDLKEFAYVATHDLKSPVVNVASFLNFIKAEKGALSEGAQEALSWMEKSINKSINTIDDLSRVLKAKITEIPDRFEELSFESLLSSVKDSLLASINASQIIIKSDFSKAPSILASKLHTESILSNIISNAIRFRSMERKPEVEISSKAEKNFICLSIKDNGIGFEAKNLTKVFGMFKKAHAIKTGSGLGMYMTKLYIEKMGGKVEADSKLGEGTCFKVYFKKF